MTVKLTGNFLATARCLIFEDGNGITWEFDPTTNELTANASGSSTNTAANISGGLAGDIPYQTGVGATTFLAPGSDGNLLTLSGGLPVWEAVPTWNQNTSGTAATATNVPYSGLTGSVPTWNQNTSGTAAGLSVTLAIGSGGTGQTTAITAFEALSPMTTTGDIIYAPGGGTATRLGIGSSGQVLTVGGGIPGWSTPASVPAAANPSGTVGLSTANGVATTYMRSDGAPALSQAIAPTWTGLHTWTGAVNAHAIVVNGGTNTSNTFLVQILTGTASGFSSGLNINAGTTSADAALLINNAANSTTMMEIYGDNHGSLGAGLTWTVAGAVTSSAGTTLTTAVTLGSTSSGTVGFYGKTPAAQTASVVAMQTSLLTAASTAYNSSAFQAHVNALQEVMNVLFAIGIYATH